VRVASDGASALHPSRSLFAARVSSPEFIFGGVPEQLEQPHRRWNVAPRQLYQSLSCGSQLCWLIGDRGKSQYNQRPNKETNPEDSHFTPLFFDSQHRARILPSMRELEISTDFEALSLAENERR
jgi:hypothetical protein